jgi:hypothetical protein
MAAKWQLFCATIAYPRVRRIISPNKGPQIYEGCPKGKWWSEQRNNWGAKNWGGGMCLLLGPGVWTQKYPYNNILQFKAYRKIR